MKDTAAGGTRTARGTFSSFQCFLKFVYVHNLQSFEDMFVQCVIFEFDIFRLNGI